MNPQEIHSYLNTFINFELILNKARPSEFKLERMQRLLNLLGNPDKSLKVIHIAGSKGKGSACSMTANILKEAGYKVGLYTSPHLNSCHERIRILEKNKHFSSGDEIFPDSMTDTALGRILNEIRPTLEKMRRTDLGELSFFEVFTALALYYFCEEKVDFAVLETGLGGRLDATNAVNSMICAIMPISLEHTRLLGDTISQIAEEKAAIIKNTDQKVVIAPQDDDALEVIMDRCQKFQIKPFVVSEAMEAEVVEQNPYEQVFDIKGKNNQYNALVTNLLGSHQIHNASVALGIIKSLIESGFRVSGSAVHRGIKNAFWPGRFEIFHHRPIVILDSAHNQASAKSAVKTFKEIFPNKKATMIVGFSNDKNIRAILNELKCIAKCVIATRADHPRSSELSGDEMFSVFKNQEIIMTDNAVEAFQSAQKNTSEDGIIFCIGSLFLVSEMRKQCISLKV